MKRSILIALVAAVAMVGCKGGDTPATTAGNDSPTTTASSGLIAYVQMDSLLSGYDMAVELNAAFKAKADRAEKDVNARSNSLQRELMDYQEKMQKGLLLRSEAADIEKSLAKKQENLVAYRDKLLGELGEEQNVLTNKIFYSISDYLKEYNADYHYSMIIETTAQGPILSADPSLDITSEVLAELNRRYATEKKKK